MNPISRTLVGLIIDALQSIKYEFGAEYVTDTINEADHHVFKLSRRAD